MFVRGICELLHTFVSIYAGWQCIIRLSHGSTSAVDCWQSLLVRTICIRYHTSTFYRGIRCVHSVHTRRKLRRTLTLLEPQPRFGGNLFKFQVDCPQNGIAVLEGLNRTEAIWFRHSRFSAIVYSTAERAVKVEQHLFGKLSTRYISPKPPYSTWETFPSWNNRALKDGRTPVAKQKRSISYGINPLSAAVHRHTDLTMFPNKVCPKRECSPNGVDPFFLDLGKKYRTARDDSSISRTKAARAAEVAKGAHLGQIMN